MYVLSILIAKFKFHQDQLRATSPNLITKLIHYVMAYAWFTDCSVCWAWFGFYALWASG